MMSFKSALATPWYLSYKDSQHIESSMYSENWQLWKLMKDNAVAAMNQINMDNMGNIPPTQGAVPDIRGLFHL